MTFHSAPAFSPKAGVWIVIGVLRETEALLPRVAGI